MRLYTSDGCAYQGMDEATVVALRLELGKSTTFITAAEYADYVAVNAPIRRDK